MTPEEERFDLATSALISVATQCARASSLSYLEQVGLLSSAEVEIVAQVYNLPSRGDDQAALATAHDNLRMSAKALGDGGPLMDAAYKLASLAAVLFPEVSRGDVTDNRRQALRYAKRLLDDAVVVLKEGSSQ